MIIHDIFEKRIDREINGVIKVGQGENENVKQELEEYVVTKELQKHFADFFSSYKRGITSTTDKMGVWISGFFGSGKSHFLKILSYLLENKIVDGKAALDYFVDDHKIEDRIVLADMKLAAETSTDVILFNVDSKGESTGKQDKDAIVSVFLKAFNEMQGFCGAYPFVADLERRLTAEGKYEAFKKAFADESGSDWLEERYAIDFVQDEIVAALSEVSLMSEEAARNWCEKATEPYAISIERFADLVKKYIENKGHNHHVVFLVDEIGQYIGDDSKLMLNLQTVTEDLGTACQGKAWVIVTSQQDIDSITKTKGNDFSKIQGRFDTRLSLSSANADEVIRKRILLKTSTATSALSAMYDEKATIIKNLILFNDGIEKKLYSDASNFAAVYPFIPYQFNLLGSVLTAIRTFGASGKHLADGERSLLALFKESAMRVSDKDIGTLVPFYMFYAPLEEFIDHSHKIVITHALDNEYLNPNKDRECFDVDVLKALFMIKYVKEIKANLDNITSLMVSHIDEDRLELRQKVEDALKRLIRQTLVQKSGDNYIFLTNEEQEINRAVEAQAVEPGEITGKVSELIFDGLYDEKKYRFSKFNGRYSYSFNQIVDDKPYKAGQNHHLTLKILTPNSEEISDEATMRMLSGQGSCVLVVLPDDRSFLDEIRSSLQIEKFIRFDSTNAVSKYEQIKADKRVELREHNERAKLFLEEALKGASIYVNGDKVQPTGKEVSSRINDAMGKLAESVFHKLHYIDLPTGDSDLRAIFKANSQQVTLGDKAVAKNELALNDVNDFIALNTSRHTKTSMKTVMDRFMAPPYGFIEADVQWLLARLFKNGDISFYVNNEAVTLLSKGEDEIIRYLTRKEYTEKLMMERRVKANDKQKKAVREVMKELFHITPSSEDDDAMMNSFMRCANNLKSEIEKLEIRYTSQPQYPGKFVVGSGKRLLNEIIQMKYPTEFFAGVDARLDSLLDFAEDFEPIRSFFAGEQLAIFDKAILLMGIYDDSKTFIVDEEVERTATEIKAIMQKSAPFGEIHKLPELHQRFISAYHAVLSELEKPILDAIDEARARVFEELNGKSCHDQLVDSFISRFDELKDKATHCNNVATMQNIKVEADALKVRCLNEIAAVEKKLLDAQARKAEQEQGGDIAPTPAPKPVVKNKKTISIKAITAETTWQLETEADVKKHIAALEQKLLKALEEGTIINIEF